MVLGLVEGIDRASVVSFHIFAHGDPASINTAAGLAAMIRRARETTEKAVRHQLQRQRASTTGVIGGVERGHVHVPIWFSKEPVCWFNAATYNAGLAIPRLPNTAELVSP